MDSKALEQKIIETLKEIYDPEIPASIWDIGLIYEVNVKEDASVHIVMTLTSPACPVAETLPVEVEQKVAELPEVKSAKVEITFDPPWEPDMMTEEAKLECGLL